MNLINNLLIWSEVWALLIPLCFIFPIRKQKTFLKPVCYYLIIALILNLVANIISNQKAIGLPLPWHSNTMLYNLHSFIRFACFASFFILLKQKHYVYINKIIPYLYAVILLLNFILFNKSFTSLHINGNLMTAESYLLLVYCLLYYLSKLKDEGTLFKSDPGFWVVTGLAVYVVINFFVFLFYAPMIDENSKLADSIWTVHNVGYILFCLFIAKAFSVAKNYKSPF